MYSKDPFVYEKLEPVLDTDIVINARGQSSLVYPKKQYTVRFVDENGFENPKDLLEMPAHDKWVLNGMYSDPSMLRNYLAYMMGRQTMEYAPDTRFVDVYIKTYEEQRPEDQYAGIYLLTDKKPKNPIVIFQIIEYIRVFLNSRVSLNGINGNLIISGAFGLYKKQAVVNVGGYSHGLMGEDMEIIVKIHSFYRKKQDSL